MINRAHSLWHDLRALWIAEQPGTGVAWRDQAGQRDAEMAGGMALVPTTIPGSAAQAVLDGEDGCFAPFPEIALGTTHTIAFSVIFNEFGGIPLAGFFGNTAYVGYAPFDTTVVYSATVSRQWSGLSLVSGTPYRFVFKRIDETLWFYINGVKVSPTETLSANTALSLSQLGAYEAGQFSLDGALDAVMFSFAPWSPTQVMDDYILSKLGFPGLLRKREKVGIKVAVLGDFFSIWSQALARVKRTSRVWAGSEL